MIHSFYWAYIIISFLMVEDLRIAHDRYLTWFPNVFTEYCIQVFCSTVVLLDLFIVCFVRILFLNFFLCGILNIMYGLWNSHTFFTNCW